ncbi:MAG: DUF5684 domain-containing protein [Candidatus Saccharimonas sp.]
MDTTYTTTAYDTTTVGDPGLFLVSMMIVFTIMFLPIILLVVIPAIIGLWKTFTKASQPGWASIVPIYNTIVLLKIVGRPVWWFVLLLVPFVSIVISLVIFVDLARAFGKDVTFGILTWLFSPIMLLIIGFNKDIQYKGAVAQGTEMFSSFHGDSAPTQPGMPVAPESPVAAPILTPETPVVPPVTPEVPVVGGQPTPAVDSADPNKTV